MLKTVVKKDEVLEDGEVVDFFTPHRMDYL